MCAYVCTCVLLTTTVRLKKKWLEAVFIFTADCTFFPTADFPTGNQSLKGRASRIICDVTNIRQTDRCLKFTRLVRKCVCIK